MYFDFNLIICLDNYIDITALKNMQLHHVEKLLLLYPLGVIIKFEASLKSWQKTLPKNDIINNSTKICDSSITSA